MKSFANLADAGRALAWHYDDFDTIDDATTTRLLEAQ